MINQNRLRDEFIKLVSLDSLSKQEGRLAAYVQNKLKSLGFTVTTDNAGKHINGECGNIIGSSGFSVLGINMGNQKSRGSD